MDFTNIVTHRYIDDFVASRRASAARFGSRPSLMVVMLARLAAGVRRGAGRLEAWARGVDGGAAVGRPAVSPRQAR
ncbi:MAG: hypothetical protein ACKVT1_04925 [Dehalococcoidia bacterium]